MHILVGESGNNPVVRDTTSASEATKILRKLGHSGVSPLTSGTGREWVHSVQQCLINPVRCCPRSVGQGSINPTPELIREYPISG